MTSSVALYDANVPSDGRTIDTRKGPVDMVAVLRYVNGETGIELTPAERSMAWRLDPGYRRYRLVDHNRAEAYRRLARTLTAAA